MMIPKCLRHMQLPMYFMTKRNVHGIKKNQLMQNKNTGPQRINIKTVLLTSGFIGLVGSLFSNSDSVSQIMQMIEPESLKTELPNQELINLDSLNPIAVNSEPPKSDPVQKLSNNVETSTPKQRNNFIVDVTKKCSPSVVFIEIKDPRRILPETGQPITASNGSGFVVSEDGYILTNAHVVINRPNSITMVSTDDGTSYKATIEDIDMKTDLALLKIQCDKLPALKFGDSKDISPGEWVVALGSPLSLSHSITAGVISSVGRSAEDLGLNNSSMQYIQTDAAITFGHSGGPLVNLNGEVIGINNLRITAGIAFAIPSDYVKEFLEHSSMHFPRKLANRAKNFIGITALSINADVLRQLMVEDSQVPRDLRSGVLVWKVIERTPAHEAGLRSGDIITHINGRPVQGTADLYALLADDSNKNSFSVYRAQAHHDFKIYVNGAKHAHAHAHERGNRSTE